MSLFSVVPATIEESGADGDKTGDQSDSGKLILAWMTNVYK